MEYLRLSDCSAYSNKRTNNIQLETYISTENMLPNKGGVAIAESIPDCKTASKYEPHDILLSNIRPYFCKIWYADKEGSCSNDVLVLKAKKGFFPKFLYYVLSDQNFFNYDTVTSKGTKMPRGSKNAIMKYLVPDVNIDIQHRIASILSAYDNLIENNNRRIRLLEQMAGNLYKEWFVRFRFPGYEKAEFENGLPKGWNKYSIKDLCEINKNTLNSKDTLKQIEYLDTSSITCNRIDETVTYNVDDAPSRAKRKIRHNSVIFSTVRPNLKHYGILRNVPNNFIVSTGFAVFDAKNNIAYIIFSFLKSQEVIDYCQLIAEGAVATYPSIKPEEIGRLKMILPPLNIAEKWNSKIEKIYSEINNIQHQSDNLSRQRDLLLPRLMSGKLEVKI